MSGIAEILCAQGFEVSGSDIAYNAACERLRVLGARITIGHTAAAVPGSCTTVVYSSAVSSDNVELQEACRRGITVVHRGQLLEALMRQFYRIAVSGSHGKTTTSALIGSILEYAQYDPMVLVGGQIRDSGSGARVGAGRFFVAETDESDKSFLSIHPDIAVVTNIDTEHMTAYDSLDDLLACFEQFASRVPFYGTAVLCVDNSYVRRIAQAIDSRVVTYGIQAEADYTAKIVALEKQRTVARVYYRGKPLLRVAIPLMGEHMLLNTLAAVAVAIECEVPPSILEEAIACYSGVARRMEEVAVIEGITVINDYAHHPTEIQATLSAIRIGWGTELRSLTVLFQPHRYSRTRDCFDAFRGAFEASDRVIVSEIYSAGEQAIDGITGAALSRSLQHPCSEFHSSLETVLHELPGQLVEGDVVVCMGAGSIGAFSYRLADAIRGYHEARDVCGLF